MIWLYGIGFAFIHGGYVDLMRNRNGQPLNTVFELIGGLAYLGFLIWGFIAFDWWVPIVMPIAGMLVATFVTARLVNLPHVFIILGSGLCLFSILSK